MDSTARKRPTNGRIVVAALALLTLGMGALGFVIARIMHPEAKAFHLRHPSMPPPLSPFSSR